MDDPSTFLQAAQTHSLETAGHARIRIERVSPEIDGGRYPIKREVGDTLTVTADIFRDGHEKIAADLFFKPWYRASWESVPMESVDNDGWTGSFVVGENTRYDYTIGAIPDHYQSWVEDATKKIGAGLDVHLEIAEGLALLQDASTRDFEDAEGIRNFWTQRLQRSLNPKHSRFSRLPDSRYSCGVRYRKTDAFGMTRTCP